MGKADTITKDYMKKNGVFADAFNYFIYGGRQVIQPESLHEMDPTEIAALFDYKNKKTVQKFRDLLKKATLMSDGKAAYLILGIESESKVNYAEPVKNGLYDFLRYTEQVRRTAAKHRKERDWNGHNHGEFLSGFYKEDKLTPVITLVILFGAKQWDGPRTLHEMMSIQDPEIQKYVADYKLNLIEPAAMGKEELKKFRTDLRSVLGFIKYSDDKAALEAFMSEESGLKGLDVEAARVISACTNTEIAIDEEEEAVDMCKAVQEMNEEARREGEQIGRREARLETLRDNVKSIMESFHLSMEEAMKSLKVTKEDQALLMKSCLK